MEENSIIAILGTGSLGMAIADGLVASGLIKTDQLILTRRKTHLLDKYENMGVRVTKDNIAAIEKADIIIIAVEPQQLNDLLEEIVSGLDEKKHTVISVVTGVSTKQILRKTGKTLTLVRAMPNTAIGIRESMTCLASESKNGKGLAIAESIFNTVGQSMRIEEELMGAATALGACGIAFFLRAIRAASQGGIEIGFHPAKALQIAAQTAKGAASLLLENEQHPEFEIDKVTTPRGVTISGLNQMEHDGFSSAMIKGIVTSATKAEKLYEE
jgi:pyrroline-5-carboxylate reductase